MNETNIQKHKIKYQKQTKWKSKLIYKNLVKMSAYCTFQINLTHLLIVT